MGNMFQLIGEILASIILIIGDIFAILRFKSSKRNKNAELWLFEGLTRSSASAIVVLLFFVAISRLFVMFQL